MKCYEHKETCEEMKGGERFQQDQKTAPQAC